MSCVGYLVYCIQFCCVLQPCAHPIATGNPEWQTEVKVVDSGIEGPTVMLIGGIHGNEPAPPLACKQIAGWEITNGRLVIIPRANVLALDAKTRRTPNTKDEHADLNRQFPSNDSPQTELAQALWAVVKIYKPALLIDMHEGYDFHKLNSDSVGSTIIYDATENTNTIATSMLDSINESITDKQKKFSLLRHPIEGSLARAAHEQLNIPSMIIETTKKNQATTFRVRQQRHLVHKALRELGMIEHGPDVLVGTYGNDGDVAVAMYVSAGVSGSGPNRLESLLDESHGFDLRRVCATDIREGALSQFDVVIFPGGSGSGQARSLDESGRKAVIDFVEDGGGYVGICAGAYLASTGYDWSLGIIDAKVIDRKHWKRGKGMTHIEWQPNMMPYHHHQNALLYANGPLYAPADVEELIDYTTLAIYKSEINTNNAPEGVMLNSPAIVTGNFKDGTVVCISPHPEQTEGCDSLLRDLVLLAD